MAQDKLQKEFIELISSQQKLIHSICSLYFASTDDRKDVFQEIVLQLWKSYPAFKFQSKASTWIYRIALNTIFSRLRKEKNKPGRQSLSEAVFQIPESETSGLETSIENLYQAINQLSEVDKAVIMLYLDEHSYDEMAHLLKMSRTNVSTRINRIKVRLFKLLKLSTT
ncbi:sigma-70 family RNA polymerase sigma factor [Xanthocytophaga agilis]|uniref:Sigma-70 family RNA polymerase sigma factor n=1 Tax=Xanthocytophaga agilis TaxID=3048010 RepID=A0AAE3R3E7_9BACT|nr:sigma-70 family RNA polymerase sigma factor [Xanthocytophaga agilis]MDJ1503096.1 sigma-70 family RNA polymerase sigma factor [Xanthocytophaga agilis]